MLEFLMFILGKITFFTGSILTGSSFPKPMSEKEEEECIKRLLAGDEEAKNQLIERNMRLVAHVVKKYNGVCETDDLISVGSIGLIKAINTFSPEKGNKLATYTARCIENEILMLIRSNKKYKNDVSLVTPVGRDKDGNELTFMDLLYEQEDAVFDQVDKSIEREKFIKFVKSVLNDREYKVISLRYGLSNGKSYAQREVASFLKISRSYISRIEKKAIEKLRLKAKKINFNGI